MSDVKIENITDPFCITFGKYKNKHIKNVLTDDFKYCVWLKNKDFITKEIRNYINEHIKDDEYYLSFGKYKNTALSWVYENDKKYIEYLKKDDFVKKNMRKLIKAIDLLELKINDDTF